MEYLLVYLVRTSFLIGNNLKIYKDKKVVAALHLICQYSPSLILAYRIAKVFGKTIEDVFEINDEVK